MVAVDFKKHTSIERCSRQLLKIWKLKFSMDTCFWKVLIEFFHGCHTLYSSFTLHENLNSRNLKNCSFNNVENGGRTVSKFTKSIFNFQGLQKQTTINITWSNHPKFVLTQVWWSAYRLWLALDYLCVTYRKIDRQKTERSPTNIMTNFAELLFTFAENDFFSKT